MSRTLIRAVVVDVGEHSIKFGYAGDEKCRIIPHALASHDSDRSFEVGESVIDRYLTSSEGRMDPPRVCASGSSRGIVDFVGFSGIIRSVCSSLGTTPSEQPLFLVEPEIRSRDAREEMARVMFEEVGVPALYAAPASTCALFASGKTSGIAIDIGESSTRISAIEDAYQFLPSLYEYPYGGRKMTQRLIEYVSESSPATNQSTSFSQFIEADRLKRRLQLSAPLSEELLKECNRLEAEREKRRSVPLPRVTSTAENSNLDSVQASGMEVDENVELKTDAAGNAPDQSGQIDSQNASESLESYALFGKSVTICDSLLQHPVSPFFDDSYSLTTLNSPPLAESILASISCLDLELRLDRTHSEREKERDLLYNAVLFGGGAHIRGLDVLLTRRLEELQPSTKSVRVTCAPDPWTAAWSGASMTCELPNFQNSWCGRPEYDEIGPVLITQKCVL